MMVPIGIHGQEPGRFPWLTVVLVLGCIALSGYAWQAQEREQAEIRSAHAKALEYFEARPYLDLDERAASLLFAERDPEKRSATIARMRRAYPFRVVDLQLAMDQPKLDRLTNELAARFDEQALWRWGLVPARPSLPSWLTHLFLHPSWPELAANLAFLFVAGCLLEALWPRGLFAGVFAGAGLASAGAFTLLHPDLGLPLAGASGAVAGLMGAVAARFATVKLRLGPIGAPGVLLLAPWLAAEVLLPPGPDWTIAGGFGLGAALAVVLRATGLELSPAPARRKSAAAEPASTDPAVQLRRELQAGRLDAALERLEALDEQTPGAAVDPSVLVRLGAALAQAGRGDDASGVLARALPAEGSPLRGAVALRLARAAQAIDPTLAARAARAGLADPALDAALRADLTELAGTPPRGAEPPRPAPTPAAAEGEDHEEVFDHGVVDLSPDSEGESLDLGAGGAADGGDFDVNDLGTNFDFEDDASDEGGAGFLSPAENDKE